MVTRMMLPFVTVVIVPWPVGALRTKLLENEAALLLTVANTPHDGNGHVTPK